MDHLARITTFLILGLALLSPATTASAVYFPTSGNCEEFEWFRLFFVGSKKVERNVWDYEFAGYGRNESVGTLLDTTVRIVQTPSNVRVLDGDLSFGDVGTFRWVYSQDTVKIRVHRKKRRTRMRKFLFQIDCDKLENSAPTSDAGPDQTVAIGATVTLDGSSSSDVDGDPLHYNWTIVGAPPGSATALSNSRAVNPSLVADLPGIYEIELVVDDGFKAGPPDAVVISTNNSTPVADAGPDQTLPVGSTALLDGGGSSDVDGDPLVFDWSLTQVPAGSQAFLSDPAAVMPSLVTDLRGTYLVELVVDDGFSSSLPDEVVVSTENSPPTADAGVDQTAPVGSSVPLDGSGSSDVDGDPLTYFWSLSSIPAGSSALLSDQSAASPSFTADLPGAYVAQLIVNDGIVDSPPDTVTVLTANSAPTANAGPDQTALVGDMVSLFGGASSDADGDPLTFFWSLTSVPVGSNAQLSDPAVVAPNFDLDTPGTYVVQLIVNDGNVDSAPDSVTIDTDNSPPVADAGPDQSVAVGDLVSVNGAGSSDVDGDPLSYRWSLVSAPAGTAAALSDPNAVAPTFVVDLPGTYIAQLIVNDGFGDSGPNTVNILTVNSAPVANAGPDQTGLVNDVASLDGSGSTDVDGDPLTYAWSLISVPAGSSAALSDPAAVMPSFVLDVAGTYIAQLVVSDGVLASAPDSVTLTTDNSPPTADAGADQTVLVNSTVALDGSGSTDIDGDPLTFSWALLAVPAGSIAALSDSSAVMPTFDADLPGAYVVQLIVNDGLVDSTPATATIDTGNSPPVADAGADQTVVVGDTVLLDATASLDVDGDPLTFAWSLLSQPASSNALLDDPTATNPSFVADRPGSYVVQLVANDGNVDSTPDTVAISTQNSAPVANAGADQQAFVGDLVPLDGGASSDADGDPLAFFWSVTSGPTGSTATLSDPLVQNPTLQLSDAGMYLVQLIVNDGSVDSAPDTLTVDLVDPPTITITGTSVLEGDVGTTDALFTLNLSRAIGRTATVDYSTVAGSANPGLDYQSVAGTVTFPPGSTTAAVAVPIVGDTLFEPAESFAVELSNPTSLRFGGNSATGTIQNDDPNPAQALSLQPTTLALPTNGNGLLSIILSQAAPAGGLTVALISNAPSVASVPATSTIPAGATTAQVTVTAGASAGTAVVTASASGWVSDTSNVDVADLPMTLSLAGPLVGIGRTLGGAVTLSQPAPAGGLALTLVSSDPATATISPATAMIPAGSTQLALTVAGVATGGPVQLTASAAGFQPAVASVNVTGNLISLGVLPVIAPGETTSLAVSLSVPAPTGGISIDLAAEDPAIASVDVTVFIPAGLQVPNANPQVTGSALGATRILASAVGFAPDARDLTVSLSASLAPSPLTVLESNTSNLTLTLSSPAPAGGFVANLTTDDPGIATAPASVSIVAGQTAILVPIAGVSVGSTILRANAAGLAEATATIVVDPAPSINLNDLTIGRDLQVSSFGTLGAPAPAGNLLVTVSSPDPARVLLSTDRLVAGTSTLALPVNAGSTGVPLFYVQALDDSGSVNVSVTAPGYRAETVVVSLVPSGFAIWTPPSISTTVFSAPTSLQLRPVSLLAGSFTWQANQAVRGGITVNVPIATADVAVGAVAASPIALGPNATFATASFVPAGAGATTIAIIQPTGFVAPSNLATSIPVTVDAPEIFLGDRRVGRDLQVSLFVSLESAPPVPTDITIAINDDTVASLSSDPTVLGGNSVTFFGVTSTSVGTLNIHGLAEGSATITATGAGFTTDTASVTVDPSGVGIWTPVSISTTTFSVPTNLQVRPVRLAPGTLAWQANQAVRAGITLTVPIASSDLNVGVPLVDPVVLGPNELFRLASFDPVGAGTSTISVSQPTGFSTPSNLNTSILATVTAPNISLLDRRVGLNLQTGTFLSLQATPPSPVDVTVTITDPSIAVLSDSATVAGSSTVTFPGIATTSVGTLTIQGLAIGSTTITVTASGYNPRTATVDVDPAGFAIWTPTGITTTTFSANSNVQLRPLRLDPSTLNWAAAMALRAGLSVGVPVASSDPSVGTITVSPVSFNGNDTFASTSFDPVSTGTTNLTLSQPGGFTSPANLNESIVASVSAPTITSVDLIVGEDLQATTSISLGAAPPSPIDVTITVAAPSIAVVSDDRDTLGTGSLVIPGVTTASLSQIFVQGLQQGATTTVTVTAPGYNDGSFDVRVDPSGFIIWTPTTVTIASGAANRNIQVRPVRLDPITLNWAANQNVRGGLSVPVDLTSSDPTAGVVTTSPLVFDGSDSFLNTSFDPIAAGSTQIDLLTPSGFDPSSNLVSIPVTVTP